MHDRLHDKGVWKQQLLELYQDQGVSSISVSLQIHSKGRLLDGRSA